MGSAVRAAVFHRVSRGLFRDAGIAAYLGSGESFDRALVRFSESYADQNERDHAALRDAVASGRVVAATGL